MPVGTIAIPVQSAGPSHKGRVISEAVSTPSPGNFVVVGDKTRVVLRNTTASPIPVSLFADAYSAEYVIDTVTVPASTVNGGRLHLGPFGADFRQHPITDAAKNGGIMFSHGAAAGAILVDAYEEK
jgi:hypothetical protein